MTGVQGRVREINAATLPGAAPAKIAVQLSTASQRRRT
jgi:hypothetical protein